MRILFNWLVLVLSLLALPCAWAVEKAKPSTPSPQVVMPKAVQPQVQLNSIAQSALNSGAGRCANRINQVTNFLAAGAQAGSILFVAPAKQNDRIASVSLEVQSSQATSYVGSDFAPSADGDCSAAYEAVTYWNAACDQVAKANFNAFRVVSPLRQNIAVLEGGPFVRVFLLNTGQGCISIKKEVVY